MRAYIFEFDLSEIAGELSSAISGSYETKIAHAQTMATLAVAERLTMMLSSLEDIRLRLEARQS